MKLAPHLHRIGNDIVAAYLVDTADGITVIDAGLPGHWRDLVRELREMGRSLDDIRGVVLTHGDSDHLGFAERLRTQYGVPVYVHSADADRATGRYKATSEWGTSKVGPVIRFLAYALSKGGFRTHYLGEVTTVENGQVLPLPGSPVVIGMPGHSPGSIAVHVPIASAIFVGDALTTRHVLTGTIGPQPAPFTDEPARALDSLSALAGLDATWVLPGHGSPWQVDPSLVEREVRGGAPAGG